MMFRGGLFDLSRVLSASVVAFGPREVEINGHRYGFSGELGPSVSHGLLSVQRHYRLPACFTLGRVHDNDSARFWVHEGFLAAGR